MIPNRDVYGARNTWLSLDSTTILKGAYCPSWRYLSDGLTADKIELKKPLDKSIGYVGLGEESPFSDIIAVAPDQTLTHIKHNVTNFFYAVEWGDYPYFFPKDKVNSMSWSVDTLDIYENGNANKCPIVAFDVKQLLWVIRVCVASNTNPIGYNDIANYYLYDYANDAAKQAQFPYLMCAYMVAAYNDGGNVPNRFFDLTSATSHPLTVCINEVKHVDYMGGSVDYIAYNDTNPVTPWYDRGDCVLLRGTSNNTGSSIFYGQNVVYVLGNEDNIVWYSGNFAYIEQWSDDVKNEIIKAAACFCNFFIGDIAPTSPYNITTVPLNDDSVYLGFPDADGISHGEYTRGADNETNPVWSWSDTSENEYDFTIVDETQYNDTSTMNTQTLETFNTMYAITATTAHKLAKVLSDAMASRPSGVNADDWALDTFLTTNPLDCIVSLKKFPCGLPYAGVGLEEIYFGSYSHPSIKGFKTAPPYKVFTFTFSRENNNFIRPVFGDSFLDYEPYTTASLYIPFCGTIDISVSTFQNHTMTVELAIDFITGACTAYVKRDGVFVTSAQGTCAVDVAVSGIQGATLDSQIFHATQTMRAAQSQDIHAKFGLLTSTIKGASNLSSGSLSAGVGALDGLGSGLQRADMATLNRENAEYELTHIQTPLKQVSGASSLLSQLCEYCCRLLIYRPIIAPDYNADVYGSTVGFATLDTDYIKNFEGFTVAASVDLNGVNCTAEEKAELLSLFANGVYL